jgi:hypothetical protein
MAYFTTKADPYVGLINAALLNSYGISEGFGSVIINFFNPTAALPISPSDQDSYISTATANGWINNYIEKYNSASGKWQNIAPINGQLVWVNGISSPHFRIWDDTIPAWVAPASQMGAEGQVIPSTTDAIVRFANTMGGLQNSTVLLDDTGTISDVNDLNATGTISGLDVSATSTVSGAVLSASSYLDLTQLASQPSTPASGISQIYSLTDGTIRLSTSSIQNTYVAPRVFFFTSSTVFTVPSGIRYVVCDLYAAGGGGGSGTTISTGGGGGSGSAIRNYMIIASSLTIVIGAAGTGGINQAGGIGGNSTITWNANGNRTITAYGGGGGGKGFDNGITAWGGGGGGGGGSNAQGGQGGDASNGSVGADGAGGTADVVASTTNWGIFGCLGGDGSAGVSMGSSSAGSPGTFGGSFWNGNAGGGSPCSVSGAGGSGGTGENTVNAGAGGAMILGYNGSVGTGSFPSNSPYGNGGGGYFGGSPFFSSPGNSGAGGQGGNNGVSSVGGGGGCVITLY